MDYLYCYRPDKCPYFDLEFYEKTKTIKPSPYVKITSKNAIVRTVIFTKWGGFIEL